MFVQAVPLPRQQLPAPPSFTEQAFPAQQSLLVPHAPPSVRQQVSAAQAFEVPQQSFANWHPAPGAEHAHSAAPVHDPLQHSAPDVQLSLKVPQHVPFAQTPPQHSALSLQAPPPGTQQVEKDDVPEQQSAAANEVRPFATQQTPASQVPVQHWLFAAQDSPAYSQQAPPLSVEFLPLQQSGEFSGTWPLGMHAPQVLVALRQISAPQHSSLFGATAQLAPVVLQHRPPSHAPPAQQSVLSTQAESDGWHTAGRHCPPLQTRFEQQSTEVPHVAPRLPHTHRPSAPQRRPVQQSVLSSQRAVSLPQPVAQKPARQVAPEQHSLSPAQPSPEPRQAETQLPWGQPRFEQHSDEAAQPLLAGLHGGGRQEPVWHSRPEQQSAFDAQPASSTEQPDRGAQTPAAQLLVAQSEARVQTSPSVLLCRLQPLLTQARPEQQSADVAQTPSTCGLQAQLP